MTKYQRAKQKYQKAESKTDQFLDLVKNSRITVVIVSFVTVLAFYGLIKLVS